MEEEHDWKDEKIEVQHLRHFAEYRRRRGDLRTAEIIMNHIEGLTGEVDLEEATGGSDDPEIINAFKYAGRFVLPIYGSIAPD